MRRLLDKTTSKSHACNINRPIAVLDETVVRCRWRRLLSLVKYDKVTLRVHMFLAISKTLHGVVVLYSYFVAL